MSQKTLLLVSVVVAAVATLLPDMFAYYGLVLVLLGLVMGIANPIEDVATRVAMYVLAAFLPAIADAGGDRAMGTPNDGVLMDIPYVGEFVVGFLGNLATVIAGVAIMSFLLVLWTGLMAAGDDSDGGTAEPEAAEPEAAEPEAAEPEAAEPEATEPEAPSWGGDDSGSGDSEGGDDDAEAAEPEAPSWGGDDSSSGDSEGGDDEPEAAEPEATEPEAPSWGGDDSSSGDSEGGDDDAEEAGNA